MYAGLDALFAGAIAALVILPAPLVPFSRLTERLAPGPRALRPAVACCAAYGVMAAVGAPWAFHALRPKPVDEAIAGLLLVGALAAVLAFLALLLFPRTG